MKDLRDIDRAYKLYQKGERKKDRLYMEKYITEVSFEDYFFGNMTFKDDSNKGHMRSAELHFPKFGADETLYIERAGAWRLRL